MWPRVAPCTGCSEQGVVVGVTSTSPLGCAVCLVIPVWASFILHHWECCHLALCSLDEVDPPFAKWTVMAIPVRKGALVCGVVNVVCDAVSTMCCGVVCCSGVWCSGCVVWCSVVQCGAVWCGV